MFLYHAHYCMCSQALHIYEKQNAMTSFSEMSGVTSTAGHTSHSIADYVKRSSSGL